MISVEFKSANRMCWANIEYVGLVATGAPAINKGLFRGGKYTIQIDGVPRTGQVELIVHQGGLRERTIPSKVKLLFREEIMPVLVKAIPGVDHKFIGKLNLNFNEGILTNFNLAH